MNRIWSAWIGLLLGFALPAAPGETTFEHGDRPASSLYDPERALSPEMTSRLIGELEKANHRDHADVTLVLLPTVGELPPEHVARRFSEAWGGHLLNAVIVDASDRNDGPWIHASGDIPSHDRYGYIPQKIRDIVRLARQEPDREARLRSAVGQTSDMLRFLRGRTVSQTQADLTERMRMRMTAEREERMKKILMYGSVAAMFPVLGLFALCIMSYLRRKPREFPPVLWSRRLGAPHAGGNDAVVDLGRSSRS